MGCSCQRDTGSGLPARRSSITNQRAEFFEEDEFEEICTADIHEACGAETTTDTHDAVVESLSESFLFPVATGRPLSLSR